MLPKAERSLYASALARCGPKPRHVLARRRLRGAALEWMSELLSDRLALAYWRAKQCVRRGAAPRRDGGCTAPHRTAPRYSPSFMILWYALTMPLAAG